MGGGFLRFVVRGAGGGTWSVRRKADRWIFVDADVPATATVAIDVDTAWRLCTRAIQPETAWARAQVEGDQRLARRALSIVSIIRAPDRCVTGHCPQALRMRLTPSRRFGGLSMPMGRFARAR